MRAASAARPQEQGIVPAIPEKHGGQLAGATDLRVWLRLLSCSTTIEKRLRRRFQERFDTTLPRFDVLATLHRHGRPVAMGQLSHDLLVSNGNVTAVVRELERQGLVMTQPSEEDRRLILVSMTETGQRRFGVLAQAHHGWIGDMFAGMTAQDQHALHALLATLKASIAIEGHAEPGA